MLGMRAASTAARRVVAFEAVQAAPSIGQQLGEQWAKARRDKQDPLYAVRETAGL